MSETIEYFPRIIDSKIDIKAKAFGAINITGAKGCGKTRTAKERCKTCIEFQDEERRVGYLAVANNSPTLFLNNLKPILFDEWQDAPKIWGTVRKACDDHPLENGAYYLTGSTSAKVDTPHTGTGRIAEITMFPMSLWEMRISSGEISLNTLFHDKNVNSDGFFNPVNLEDYFYLICQGGWPRTLYVEDNVARLEVAREYYQQIFRRDISALDGTKRDSELARTILWSYARNMATLAKKKNLYSDVRANHNVSDQTIANYIGVLEKLFVITDIDAWTPQIRSKTAIRAAKKHIFIDPSIAMAALGINPDYFYNDLDLFGHAFENMVFRDLLVYAQAHDAKVMHYSDQLGLEVDAIYQLSDGRYALIEIKTSENAVVMAEKNLLKFKAVIRAHNERALMDKEHPGVKYREPSLMIVICAKANMSYTTENNVKVIPFGCLKD